MVRLLMLAAVIGLAVQLSVAQSIEFFPVQGAGVDAALPPDAAKIVADHERSAIETRARADAIIEADRRATIEKLDQLARACDSTGRANDALAIRQRIATLNANAAPQPQPSINLANFRGQHGKVLTLTVTGSGGAFRGSVWGDGVYTDDSNLAAAAVHAGILAPGQTGQVMVTILPGQNSYTGSSRNGIASMAFGAWPGSYHVARARAGAPLDDMPLEPNPGNMRALRDRVERQFTYTVTGTNTGNVWGDGVYTDDSNLATAAVHAGVLAVGQTGRVTVTILPGQATYTGVTRHGIASAAYGSWAGSYRIERATAFPVVP